MNVVKELSKYCGPTQILAVLTAVQFATAILKKKSAMFVILTLGLNLLTTYTVNCLCKGKCMSLAMVWTVIPILTTAMAVYGLFDPEFEKMMMDEESKEHMCGQKHM